MKKPVIIALVLLAGGYLAYRHFAAPAPQQQHAGGPMPVGVSPVVAKEVREWNEFSGRLRAVDHVEVRPQVGGTIEAVHFEEGALVAKGDLLFTIDPRPFEAEVSRAEAALASAKAQAQLARTEQTRTAKLLKDRFASQQLFDEKQNSLRAAEASVKAAEAALRTAQLNLEYTRISAPIAGRIGRAEITTGNLIETGPGAPVLTQIVSISPIYLDFEVDEQTYLSYLRHQAAGQDAVGQIPVAMAVTGEEGFPHEGRIVSFDNRLDPSSGTIRVRAAFDNAGGGLVPGLFARVRLGGAESRRALLVSDRAIGTDQNKKFVMVVDEKNTANYREVKLGPVVEGLRVIRDGLSGEERIVVSGLQRVRPGAPVVPEEAAMDGSAPAAPNTDTNP